MTSFATYVCRFSHPLRQWSLLNQSPSLRPLNSISYWISFFHLFLGLPCFLLCDGFHFHNFIGNLSVLILCRCPYHLNCLSFILSMTVLFAFILWRIVSFLTRSSRVKPKLLRQYIISEERSFWDIFLLITHASDPYIITG